MRQTLQAATLGAALALTPSVAFAAESNLPSYVPIVIVGNVFFFGFLIGLWYVGKRVFPRWEARQIERQRELQADRERHRAAEGGAVADDVGGGEEEEETTEVGEVEVG